MVWAWDHGEMSPKKNIVGRQADVLHGMACRRAEDKSRDTELAGFKHIKRRNIVQNGLRQGSFPRSRLIRPSGLSPHRYDTPRSEMSPVLLKRWQIANLQ